MKGRSLRRRMSGSRNRAASHCTRCSYYTRHDRV